MTYLESVNTIHEIKDIKNQCFDSMKIIVLAKEIERNIDFGYVHHRFLVLPSNGPELRINCISSDSIIHVGWTSVFRYLNTLHANRASRNFHLFKDSESFFTNYVSKHNTLYDTKLNKENLVYQLTDEPKVGYGCEDNIVFRTPITVKAMEYGKLKKKRKLRAFLKSFSPELQLLGAVELKKLGKLKNKEVQIIEHLKTRNSKINSCDGTALGIEENFENLFERFN